MVDVIRDAPINVRGALFGKEFVTTKPQTKSDTTYK